MIVSTSGSGDPAKINLRILSTDSPEKRPVWFSVGSTLGRVSMGDSLAVSINRPLLCNSLERRTPPSQGAPMVYMSVQAITDKSRREGTVFQFGWSECSRFRCWKLPQRHAILQTSQRGQ